LIPSTTKRAKERERKSWGGILSFYHHRKSIDLRLSHNFRHCCGRCGLATRNFQSWHTHTGGHLLIFSEKGELEEEMSNLHQPAQREKLLAPKKRHRKEAKVELFSFNSSRYERKHTHNNCYLIHIGHCCCCYIVEHVKSVFHFHSIHSARFCPLVIKYIEHVYTHALTQENRHIVP
jgi:hypothetical protein